MENLTFMVGKQTTDIAHHINGNLFLFFCDLKVLGLILISSLLF